MQKESGEPDNKNFLTSGSGTLSHRHVDCLDWSCRDGPSPSAPPSPGGVSPPPVFAVPGVFPPLVSAAHGAHALDALRFFFWVF